MAQTADGVTRTVAYSYDPANNLWPWPTPRTG